MSGTTRDFLDEYRYADLTKRLHLYLQYPEMRPEFDQIEYSESAHRQLCGQPGRTGVQKARKIRTWRLFRLVPGLEKR